jgi:DNA-binding transcriptional LysR family regulator
VVTISEGLFATPQWLAQHGPPKSLEALAKLPVLRWAEPGVDPNTLPLRAGGVMQIRPRIVSPDMHLLRQCALSSVGLAFVPDAASVPAVWSDGLVPVLPALVGADLPLRIAVPAALSELPRVRAVFEALRGFLNVRS